MTRWLGKTTLHITRSHLGKNSGLSEQQVGRFCGLEVNVCAKQILSTMPTRPKDCPENNVIILSLIQEDQARPGQ